MIVIYFNDELILDFDDTIWSRNWKTNEEAHRVSRENIQLLNELNTALAELDTTDFEEMMNTAISVQPLAQ